MQKIKAIIFDLDGVITDTAEFHYLAWKKLSEKLNYSFTREFNEELKGISRMESLEKIIVASGLHKRLNQEEKLALAEEKNNDYISLIEGITPKAILPGIEKFIFQIKREGLKIGLASVSKNAYTVIKRLELTEQFDTIVDARKIKNGKPDPEIFLTAARQLEFEPIECIGIEDAAAGIEAIKATGMFAVGIGKKDILAKADMVYENTESLSLEEILRVYEKQIS
ncbi:MAG TPA: beta-phosphoglucomutase [Bacillales bacterium]|nr:beta-phosphoglucomutase [Bacillales bacterium]